MAEKQDDLKKVRELIALMEEHDLVEVELESGDQKIHLKRPQAMMTQVPMHAVHAAPIAGAQPATLAAAPTAEQSTEDSGLVDIKSPIVGTYYAAPSPDSDIFVKTGDKVDADTVVCIIEAMKVMNEIKAETSGTIVEILVQDGQSVEYGQPLFKVRP